MPKIPEDRLWHSAAGLGSIVTVVLYLVFKFLDVVDVIILAPVIIAGGKELFDWACGRKPSLGDFLATLNPAIIIKEYLGRISKTKKT